MLRSSIEYVSRRDGCMAVLRSAIFRRLEEIRG
jgi:hypothetical protein